MQGRILSVGFIVLGLLLQSPNAEARFFRRIGFFRQPAWPAFRVIQQPRFVQPQFIRNGQIVNQPVVVNNGIVNPGLGVNDGIVDFDGSAVSLDGDDLIDVNQSPSTSSVSDSLASTSSTSQPKGSLSSLSSTGFNTDERNFRANRLTIEGSGRRVARDANGNFLITLRDGRRFLFNSQGVRRAQISAAGAVSDQFNTQLPLTTQQTLNFIAARFPNGFVNFTGQAPVNPVTPGINPNPGTPSTPVKEVAGFKRLGIRDGKMFAKDNANQDVAVFLDKNTSVVLNPDSIARQSLLDLFDFYEQQDKLGNFSTVKDSTGTSDSDRVKQLLAS